jgi:CubicO group peptidase (beta-lactamase class C family)
LIKERHMRFEKRQIVVFAVIALLSMLSQGLVAQTEPFEGLNIYIAKAMKEWETPGLAIAIVKNDSVVFMKGFGITKMGESTPVTPRTLFAIASTTKAMTVACLGMLVDAGKIKWDDPVTKHLPWFQLYDPYVTRELLVRDLLCHRAGLERGDNLWYLSPYSRDEVLRRVRYLKPSWSFRSHYGYNNIMFVAAGQIIPSVTSSSWDDFITQNLFRPLGMTRTRPNLKSAEGSDDMATPHSRVDGTMMPIRMASYDNIGPAGSVISCVQDMAAWVRLNLNDGVINGKRFLSPEVIREIQMPQTVIRLDSLDHALRPSNHFTAYGLGWVLRDYLGRKLVQHDGAYDGMQARVVMVPEERLGLVILMNAEHTDLPESIAYRIVDHYLGGTARDWSAELLALSEKQREKNDAEEKKQADERVKGTKPSCALDAYVGTYDNDTYGQAHVTMKGAKLQLSFYPQHVGTMDHWHFDTFQVLWDYRYLDKDQITFVLGSNGSVEGMKWPGFGEFKKKN